MADAPRLHRYTFQDYLALEDTSTVRHEFLSGEIYAMAGGTPQHAALAMAVGAALIQLSRGRPCRVHSSDLRVRVLETGLATYPDVTVVCGPYELDPASQNTVVNPLLIAEVTSDSTEEYDHGEKLENYRRIPSLSTVLLISHRERLIEAFERDGERWKRSEARPGASLKLQALGGELAVDEIYATAVTT
jgi:Uma2 family endonuclease